MAVSEKRRRGERDLDRKVFELYSYHHNYITNEFTALDLNEFTPLRYLNLT